MLLVHSCDKNVLEWGLNSLQLLQQTVWMCNCLPQMFHSLVSHFIQAYAQRLEQGRPATQQGAQRLKDRLGQIAPLQAAEWRTESREIHPIKRSIPFVLTWILPKFLDWTPGSNEGLAQQQRPLLVQLIHGEVQLCQAAVL